MIRNTRWFINYWYGIIRKGCITVTLYFQIGIVILTVFRLSDQDNILVFVFSRNLPK